MVSEDLVAAALAAAVPVEVGNLTIIIKKHLQVPVILDFCRCFFYEFEMINRLSPKKSFVLDLVLQMQLLQGLPFLLQ